eukprot:Pgem_evm1s10929
MDDGKMKMISLITLIVQNTSVAILLGATKVIEGSTYLASTAVVCQEVIKMLVCLCIIWKSEDFNFLKLKT